MIIIVFYMIISGVTNFDILLTVVFTLHQEDTLIRVISARAMSKKERIYYVKID